MTMKRIHFHKISGYFPWGRGFGEGVNWRNGTHETDNPVVIAAAVRDLEGAQKYVEAVAEVAPQEVPPVITPEPKAEIRCNHCGVFFPEPEYGEHVKTLGRSTEEPPKVAEKRKVPHRATPLPMTARR